MAAVTASHVTREQSELRFVKGIGPKRAVALEKVGVRSLRDLLYYFPRRYEDRSQLKKISEILPGETLTVRGRILAADLKRIRRLAIVEARVGDETGMLTVVWFNQAYLKRQLIPGTTVILHGKADYYQNRLQMQSPEHEILDDEGASAGVHTGRITPVYPLTEGLYQRSLRLTLRDVVSRFADAKCREIYPPSFLKEEGLTDLPEAVRQMHFPESFEALAQARRRIVFDEFLLFEITLLRKIEKFRSRYHSPSVRLDSGQREAFEKSLPFKPTDSQKEALESIAKDMAETVPMNRLLMGDVGSGKTVVAAFAAFAAARAKMQSAMLVPTEILARQHYETLKNFLEPVGQRVKLLTASTPAPKRERWLAELRQGKVDVLIGTHALLQDDVTFTSLALVIIDEQHKFGVHQRCKLLEQNPRPHQLVMTATPIPRTLALTLYGDLSISAMRELPKGRRPVKTYWITRKKQREVLKHILDKVKMGEQAYFIFPLIEETEKSDLLAATREYEKMRDGVFRRIKTGLVHGKMSGEERDAVMKRFREGEIGVLVATSVVEVGVDNPNATVMVIENAERFGLSQLHQMRGRIGRGEKPSECFLFGEPGTDEGKRRLRIMTKTHDGFTIAEEDLRLRGPGDFLGVRQSGEPLFKVANPVTDENALVEARRVAVRLVKQGGLERDAGWKKLKNYLEEFPIRY